MMSETAPRSDELLAPIRRMLAKLGRSQTFETGDIEAALREITEASAAALGVARASVWRFNADLEELECLDLYERPHHRHAAGTKLFSRDTPRYFRALAEERTIPAHDAATDPRTSEFDATYLRPHGITSMLDAPILLSGKLVGVVCNEHVGSARTWQPWEELVAGTFADFVAMVLGAVERATQAKAIDAYRAGLEKLVDERTKQLRSSEENFRKLFDAAPVGLILSRVSDNAVLEANPRAAALFGVDVDKVRGQLGPEFWVDERDRKRLIGIVREKGTVDGFEVQLKRRDGTPFWGDVAVRLVALMDGPALVFGVRDITAQKAAAEALRSLFDAAPIPMVLTGLDDAVVRACNRRFADMFETTVDAVVGRRAPDFYEQPDDRTAFLDRRAPEGVVDGYAVRLKTFSGRAFWVLMNARTLSVNGDRCFMVGFADLTEQKAIEEKLRALATTDSLTGALNRRRLFEVAEDEVLRSARYERPMSIAMFDLDHFKPVNDRYGHAVGDVALQLVVTTLRDSLRRNDRVGRYGGEEFVVVFPETTADDAARVAERARAAIEGLALEHDGHRVPLSVSIGVVERLHDESFASMLKRADAALYEAKDSGRNRVVVRA